MNFGNINIPKGVDRISASEFRQLVSSSTPSHLADKPRGKIGGSVKSVITIETAPPTEHEEQRDLVSWLRLMGIRHHATPSGGHRATKTARDLRSEGVVKGVPDITIWPEIGSGLPIVYIEMKRTKGGKLSEEQVEWLSYLNQLSDAGYPIRAYVAKGFNEARQILEDIGFA